MVGKYCAVSPGGDKITIALSDESGAPREITLSFDEASALAMTLPTLLSAALGQKFSDPTLRHVYPAQAYAVECASDQRHLLLTLSSSNGFEIVFALEVEMVPSLTRALCGNRAMLETAQPQLPN